MGIAQPVARIVVSAYFKLKPVKEIKSFISLPLQFKGLEGAAHVYKVMPDRNAEGIAVVFQKANDLFVKAGESPRVPLETAKRSAWKSQSSQFQFDFTFGGVSLRDTSGESSENPGAPAAELLRPMAGGGHDAREGPGVGG